MFWCIVKYIGGMSQEYNHWKRRECRNDVQVLARLTGWFVVGLFLFLGLQSNNLLNFAPNLASVARFLIGATPALAASPTYIYAPVTISAPTTWTLAQSPYVIHSSGVVSVTSTLTIEPGVVIKFVPNRYISYTSGIKFVSGGKLVAQGTADLSIVFTSYFDDTSGGDTNSDGGATTPLPGDWGSLSFTSDSSILSFVFIRYGGNTSFVFGSIEVKNNSQVNITDSIVTYSKGSGIELFEPSRPVIERVKVEYNNSFGVSSALTTLPGILRDSSINYNRTGALVLASANTLLLSNNTFIGNQPQIILVKGDQINHDTVWSYISGLAHVLNGNYRVPSGVTLTIEPGVVVKFMGGGRFVINGRLLAQGTVDQPIVFTSYLDDSFGGDSNNDNGLYTPAPGNWSGLYFDGSTGSVLTHAILRYGGYYLADFNGVYFITTDWNFLHIKNSGVSINSSVIEKSYDTGISVGGNSNIQLTNSEIKYHKRGIMSYTLTPWSMNGSKLFGNSIYAINASTNSALVDARNNWWGSDTGPTIYSNPSGIGDKIYGNLLYDPWTGKIPPNQPPVLSYTDTDGYRTDGVEPNIAFIPSAPVFKATYTDVNNDAPSYFRVVVNGTPHEMTKDTGQDGTYSNGEQYFYNSPIGYFGKGNYSYHFEASDGKVATRLPATGELIFEVKNVPVLLIPGILGTEMKKGDDTLWMDFGRMLADITDGFMDPLAMDEDGNPIDAGVTIGDVIRRPLIVYDYFQGLVNEFAINQYFEGTDLFIFPYDWRLDNRVNSVKLQEKINQILSQTGSSKIDLVTHSMGGLIAKQYIVNSTNPKIGKLIFIGTPHLGAPKALKTLMFGDRFGVPWSVLNPGEMKKISRNMYSVYQLLPSREYFNKLGGYYSAPVWDDPGEHKLLNFLETQLLMLSGGYNLSAIQDGADFHTPALDLIDLSSYGIDSYNISGCTTPTISGIVQVGSVADDEYLLYMNAGDKTVPLGSSTAVNVPNDHNYYYKNASHGKMPSQDGVRELVTQIITNNVNNSSLPTDVIQDKSQCVLNGKFVSVHSPVELHVYDEQGNHTGPADNNTLEESINGLSYEEVSGNKFVFIPSDNGQNYKIKLVATDNGNFDLRVKSIENSNVTQTVYYNKIAITSASRGEMVVNNTSADNIINLDFNGSGSFEPIPASAVLNASQSQDLTAPITTVVFSGTAGNNGWYKSDVVVSLTAIDDNSGVLRTEYSLDTGVNWFIYQNPFTVNKEGSSTLFYRSIDKAGNKEQNKSQTIKIDKTPPEANIVFSSQLKDIVISGSDNISAVTIVDNPGLVTLTDEAGNTVELIFKERSRVKLFSATLLEIKYNGISVPISKNSRFDFYWGYNKQGELNRLIQSIMVKNDFRILANWDYKKNITRITGKDVVLGKIKEKLNEMVLIKISIVKGDLSYNY